MVATTTDVSATRAALTANSNTDLATSLGGAIVRISQPLKPGATGREVGETLERRVIERVGKEEVIPEQRDQTVSGGPEHDWRPRYAVGFLKHAEQRLAL